MMCVRMCIRMYVSVTLRNVSVTSRRNVASMMRIRTPSYSMTRWKVNEPHQTGSAPRAYLDYTKTIPRAYLDCTKTVPRAYLDRSTAPRVYLDCTSTTPRAYWTYLDCTTSVLYLDRTRTVPWAYLYCTTSVLRSGSRRVENTRWERTLSIPYHERTRSVPREYLDRTATILHCMMCHTATVPRPNLDHNATEPRPYTSTAPQPNLDRTATVPWPYRDRTGRVPVVQFVNFSTADTVCIMQVYFLNVFAANVRTDRYFHGENFLC